MIKSHADLEQSKKLADILPPESADIVLCGKDLKYVYADIHAQEFMKGLEDKKMNYVPCWSLASLLGVFEDKGFFYKLYFDGVSNVLEVIDIDNPGVHEINDNDYPIDACVAMVEKLHELKML